MDIIESDLKGRCAIVTGGSRGPGKSMAEALTDAGCTFISIILSRKI